MQRLILPAALIAAVAFAAPAFAKHAKDSAGSTFCASGKHVKDPKQCKENGGNK